MPSQPALARLPRTSRSSATATPIVARTNLGRAERVVIAGHIDTVPLNDNLPTRFETDRRRGLPLGPRHRRHEGRCRRAAQARRRAHRARGRRHLDVVRQRRGLGRPERPRAPRRATVPSCSRATSPSSASRRNGAGRGRLQRHPAGRAARLRAARALRARLGRRQRHPRGRARARPPGGLRAARGRGRRARLPRGPQRRRHLRRRRRQRHPRRGAWCTSTTASRRAAAAPRPSSTCASSSPASTSPSSTHAEGARPGLDAPLAQEFLAAVGAEARPKYGWTDVARFCCPRHPRRQLRSGRPAARRTPTTSACAVERDHRVRAGLRAWLTGADPVEPSGAPRSGRRGGHPDPSACVVRWRLSPWWVRVLSSSSRRASSRRLSCWCSPRMQEAEPVDRARSPATPTSRPSGTAAGTRSSPATGYPSELPLTADGHVGENAWAFMPVLPGARARAHGLTGAAVERRRRVRLGGVRRSGAALVFYRLHAHSRSTHDRAVRRRAVLRRAALADPAGGVRGVDVPASCSRLALLLLVRRRYWLAVPGDRGRWRSPGRAALAFALALGSARGVPLVDPARATRSRCASACIAASVAVFSGLMGLAWPADRLGRRRARCTAYTDTELAWRARLHRLQRARAVHGVVPGRRTGGSGRPLGCLVVVGADRGISALRAVPLAAVRRLGRRPAVLGGELRALPARRVLSAVEHVPAADAAVPAARGARAAALAASTGWRSCSCFVALQWGWLYICWGYDRLRLDAAVTAPRRPGRTGARRDFGSVLPAGDNRRSLATKGELNGGHEAADR